MFLESLMHKDSCFVTLTYSPERLPVDGSLNTEHARNFLKRLRARVSPRRLRFFLCGEYGDQSGRPHYHAILFGVGVNDAGVISEAWGYGFVSVFEFEWERAQYTAQYVTKKMTRAGDPRLGGRFPEFSRKSLKPGIGAPAMEVLRDAVFSRHGLAEFHRVGDVPHQLRFGRRVLALGRYLRRRLRDEIGMDDASLEAVKSRFMEEKSTEVLALLQAALSSGSVASSAQSVIVESNLGRIRSVEARLAIRKGRVL